MTPSAPAEHLVNFLEQLAGRLRVDLVARYHPPAEPGMRGTYSPYRSPLTREDLARHLTGERCLGLYVLTHELGTRGLTRAACLDLDDKKKKLTWEELCGEAKLLARVLKARNLLTWPVRSGSGHGIHLWLFWDEPQATAPLRVLLKDTVKSAKLQCHVDIYPAQDALGTTNDGERQLGNLVALPLGRESRPITDLDRGLVAEDLSRWLPAQPPLSARISAGEVGLDELARDAGKGGVGQDDAYGPVDPALLREALTHVDNSTYELWMRVGMAIKQAARDGQLGEAEGEKIWEEWASKSEKFSARDQAANWRSFNPSGNLTLGTVWHLAGEGGWKPKNVKKPKATREQVQKKIEHRLQGLPEREKEVRRRLLWLTGEAGQDVAGLNKDHFISLEGGKALIFREEWDPGLKRHQLLRMHPSDFKLIHQNQKVVVGHNGKGVANIQDLGACWLDDPYRRQYDGIVLRPEGTEPWIYNLWRGWTVEPSEDGSCELFLDHVKHNVCGGNNDVYAYLLNWCALTFQRPHEPIGTAVVLRGERGTGKGTFARVLGELFGQHFLHLTNSRDLTGRFNSHLQDCILLFADEAVWAGSKSEESTLKGIITEPYLSIEGKGRDLVQTRNMLHLIIATNNEWSAPAGLDERRFLALKMGADKKQNTPYFKKIWAQLAAGGRERLLWELLNRDVSEFSPFEVPRTTELLEQKVKSLDPWVEWWYDKLSRGTLLEFYRVGWDEPVPAQALYLDYVWHCRLAGARAPGTFSSLSLKIRGLLPREPAQSRVRLKHTIVSPIEELAAGSRQTMWTLPPLKLCREFFDKKAQQNIKWDLEELGELPLAGGEPRAGDHRPDDRSML